jgi:hypothetical protein
MVAAMSRSSARNQPSLFDEPHQPEEPRPVNVGIIRKTVMAQLYMLRRAVVMPWYDFELADWEERFPRLTGYLPPEEGGSALVEFRKEIARLKAV